MSERRSPYGDSPAVFAGALVLVWLITMSGWGAAALRARSGSAPPDTGFRSWVEELRQEALRRGIDTATVRRALSGLTPMPEVLRADRNQPESTVALSTYRSWLLTASRVRRGRALKRRHHELLQRIAARYDVPPRFLLAIWAVESDYGQQTDTYPVVRALATLGHRSDRSAFFRSELLHALRILDEGPPTRSTLEGSWAGALGQPRFLPSSYRAYAVDFDGDGHRDIWHSRPDVLASIANYLARHGWDADRGWGRSLRLDEETLGALRRHGDSANGPCGESGSMTSFRPRHDWTRIANPLGDRLPAGPSAFVFPGNAADTVFAVRPNYRPLLRYNCSHFYALTVGALADRIGEGERSQR